MVSLDKQTKHALPPRRLDVVLDAMVRLIGLLPGLWALWTAFAALTDRPPPMLGDYGNFEFPMWVRPAERFWVVSSMLVFAVSWFWLLSRYAGLRLRLGDR